MIKNSQKVLDLFYLADRHKDFDNRLLKNVEKQDFNLARNISTKESRQLYELHTNVARAICKIKSFLRFDISKHGILYTKIESEHYIVDNLLEFFHQRFPIFHIAIEDKQKTYVITPKNEIKQYPLAIKETIAILEKELPIQNLTNDITDNETSFDETLWEKYYDSQYISERKNLKLMQSLMPKKYRFGKESSAESIIAKRCKKITEFI